MKNLFYLIIILLFTTFSATAQAVVSDPALLQSMERKAIMDKASYAKQLEETKRMFSESKTIRENIQAGLKKIENVSSYVQNCQQVYNIKSDMTLITKEYSKGINFIRSEPISNGVVAADDINKFSVIYSNLLSESLSDLKSCMNIINTGFLDMDDATRLAALERIETKMRDKRQLISYLNNKIKLVLR